MALYSDWKHPNWSEIRDFLPISAFGIDHYWAVACCKHFISGVCVIAFARRLFPAINKRRRATHQWILFMAESLDVTPKTIEQNVRIGKSEAEVTNNKRLLSMYCMPTSKANTDRHKASRRLSATAEVLV